VITLNRDFCPRRLGMIGRLAALVLPLVSILICTAAANETIRIAHQTNFAPFVYVKDGRSAGLVVDILDAAAADEGITVVFVPVPFAQVDGTLTDGRADAIVPLAITPDRRKTYDFSSTLVMTGGAFFVRAPGAPPPDLASLSGKTLATPATGPFVNYIRKTAPDVKLVITTDYPETFEKVINGTVDAAALNLQVGTNMVVTSYANKITVPKAMFTPPLRYAVAVMKGRHADFLAKLDAGISVIIADGTLKKIEDRWKNR